MRILVVRRDNIGDLVCTTPLIAALAEQLRPQCLGVLANAYNGPVLAGNDHIQRLWVYTKAKHRRPGQSLPGLLAGRLRNWFDLRRQRLDHVLIAQPNPAPRLLRTLRTLGAGTIHYIGGPPARRGEIRLPERGDLHEVEDNFRLGAALGISGPPGPLQVRADAGLRQRLADGLPAGNTPRLAVHISARKAGQRLSVARAAGLIRALTARRPVRILLLWAPGPTRHPCHPGDDERAAKLMDACTGLPVQALPTTTLAELIAALDLADAALLSDGGAMHLAAGLGLPMVALFGNSDPRRWHPWGVEHCLLKADAVTDLPDDAILDAVDAMLAKLPSNGGRGA